MPVVGVSAASSRCARHPFASRSPYRCSHAPASARSSSLKEGPSSARASVRGSASSSPSVRPASAVSASRRDREPFARRTSCLRRVSDRAGQHELRVQARRCWVGADPAPGWLQPDHPAPGCGRADGPAEVVAVGDRYEPGGDGGCRPPTRSAGRVVEVPGVAGGTEAPRLGRCAGTELRGVRLPDRHEPAVHEPPGHGCILRGAPVQPAEKLVALVEREPGDTRAEVLEHDRHAGEGTTSSGGHAPAVLEQRDDDGVQRRVAGLDLGDRAIAGLARRQDAPLKGRRQAEGIHRWQSPSVVR